MKLGKIRVLLIFFISFFVNSTLFSEDKISTVPLLNLEELKPSFEEVENDNSNNQSTSESQLKKKDKKIPSTKNKSVNMLGLDKITAKTSELNIKIGETKKFGLLEIKAIKCGKVNDSKEVYETAYIQVKDTSDNSDEKVFVFNGWIFSTSPSLRPIDHPVYDLWLVSCENV